MQQVKGAVLKSRLAFIEQHAGKGGGDPQAFLAKAPQIYRLYYDTGRREYAKTGERSAVLTTFEAETFSGPDCPTVIGWHKRALELCGAKGIEIIEDECRARGGTACRYRISWA